VKQRPGWSPFLPLLWAEGSCEDSCDSGHTNIPGPAMLWLLPQQSADRMQPGQIMWSWGWKITESPFAALIL
jgi:hypothetical protein